MRLKIPGLRLVEDFADVVDWLLDGPDPGDRVRLALVRHVRSLGPQWFWVPTGTRLLRTPLVRGSDIQTEEWLPDPHTRGPAHHPWPGRPWCPPGEPAPSS